MSTAVLLPLKKRLQRLIDEQAAEVIAEHGIEEWERRVAAALAIATCAKKRRRTEETDA